MHLPSRSVLALAVTVPVVLATAAQAAPHVGKAANDAPRQGTVTLRTTDDAGHCASAPTAKQVGGTTCPTFPLVFAAPRSAPDAVVVVLHGHGHNGDQYAAQLADVAERDGVLAVAPVTNELPLVGGKAQPSAKGPFDSVDEEGRDAAAAIRWAHQHYPSVTRTFLLGTSMGGSGLAYFLDAATRPTAGDADATWVQAAKVLPLAGLVDAEGIANLPETWAEATGADPSSAKEIETETGGTPLTQPAAYRSRSLGLLPTAELKATGLPVAAVVHDVDDGLVPYNQTYETRANFAAAGIALRTYDVVFKPSCAQDGQTTATSYVGLVPGVPADQTESQLCLAGHANENRSELPVMRAAFSALSDLVRGTRTASAQLESPLPPAR